MSKITIQVSFLAGTEIRQAITEAKEKAHYWRVCYVTFNFNTVNFSIGSTANIDKAVEKFQEEVKKPEGHRFVIER